MWYLSMTTSSKGAPDGLARPNPLSKVCRSSSNGSMWSGWSVWLGAPTRNMVSRSGTPAVRADASHQPPSPSSLIPSLPSSLPSFFFLILFQGKFLLRCLDWPQTRSYLSLWIIGLCCSNQLKILLGMNLLYMNDIHTSFLTYEKPEVAAAQPHSSNILVNVSGIQRFLYLL